MSNFLSNFMEVNEMPLKLAEAINEYGPFVVILAIFLYVFYMMIKSMNKSLNNFQQHSIKNDEDYRTLIAEQNKAMMEQLISEHSLEKPKLEKDLLDTFVRLKDSIKDYCKLTMDKVMADRLAIYLFHNGSHSTHGINFFKMSCICEKVLIGCGIRERSIEHSNIPITLFDDMVDNLITNGYFVIHNDENVANTNRRIFISGKRIKYVQCVSIFDEDNNMLGFVLSESSKEYNEEQAEKEREELKVLSNQIMPILSYSDYVNTTLIHKSIE